MNKAIVIAGLAFVLMSSQAQALCPSQPENANSKYVTSGVNKSLCLSDELSDTARTIDNNTQFDSLSNDVNQLEIQRRFDNINNFRDNSFYGRP